MTPLVIWQNGRHTPIQQITDALQKAGLRVLTSFNSDHARLDKTGMFCPHHGTAVCNCHIVIMLVYGSGGHPATLITYGQDNEMWVSLAYPPGLRPSATLQSQIAVALNPTL